MLTTEYAERLDAIEARLSRWLDAELDHFLHDAREADRIALGQRPTPAGRERASASA